MDFHQSEVRFTKIPELVFVSDTEMFFCFCTIVISNSSKSGLNKDFMSFLQVVRNPHLHLKQSNL